MKRFIAWASLIIWLIVAVTVDVYQHVYENKPIDWSADTFAIAGILAAISALLVTEFTLERTNKNFQTILNDLRDRLSGTLDHIQRSEEGLTMAVDNITSAVTEIKDQTDRLHGEITNLEDATRRNLEGFHEIFARALWLIQKAEEEIWYVNFLFGFGIPHACNSKIAAEYTRIANVLKINSDFDQAVKEFSVTLLKKIRETPKFNAIVLEVGALERLCLSRLRGRADWCDLDVERVKAQENELRQGITLETAQRKFSGNDPKDCIVKEVPRLPLQLLIARIPSLDRSDSKWGCLVFLVGTENVGGGKPRGFYTELDHMAGVYRELAEGFMPEELSQAVAAHLPEIEEIVKAGKETIDRVKEDVN